MFKKICFAVCVSFLLCGAPVSANEWVDMGPLDGSAEGHIWSEVVDQVGNTRGRNEIWSVELPAKAHIEFIVKCPDPYPLEVRVQWKGEYGDLFDGPIERRAEGFYQKFENWSPEKQRDIRVVVFSRKPSTDQRYQLTVNLFGQDGKLLQRERTAPRETPLPGFAGVWTRSEGGRVVDKISIVAKGSMYELIFQESEDGPVVSRGIGRVEGNVLVVDSWVLSRKSRTVKIQLASNDILSYTSHNPDGSEPWQGEFRRR